jgi:preprotein translocase subunit SecG
MKVGGSMNLIVDLLLAIYVAVSLLLVLVVLMQRPRSEGLGTAFASGMVEQYIGPATSVLVRFTTWMAGAFFVISILLTILYAHRADTRSKIGERLRSVPALKATPSSTSTHKLTPRAVPAAPRALPLVVPSPAAMVSPAPATPALAPPPAAVTSPAAQAPPSSLPAAPPLVPAPKPAASPAH